MKPVHPSWIIAAVIATASTSPAAITLGVLTDFESGTLEGWSGGASPTNIATGGPGGVGDNFLQVGNGGSLATYNQSISGALAPNVTDMMVDMRRPSGESDLAMRLVFIRGENGSLSDRWTSTVAAVVPGDGLWRTYRFSVLEADLTRVVGSGTYEETASSIVRTMFRYNPGAPTGGGALPVEGTLGIDNVTAIPEPTAFVMAILGVFLCGSRIFPLRARAPSGRSR